MPTSTYFDSKRDLTIISQGGFFCEGCLVAKPMDDASPDPRYCQSCFEVLLDESSLLTGKRNPPWVPKPQRLLKAGGDFVTPRPRIQKQGKDGKKRRNKIDTPNIPPAGRPTLDLPVEKVRRFASQGLGSRAIAKKLKADGIKVSHMAIHRAIKKLQAELPL